MGNQESVKNKFETKLKDKKGASKESFIVKLNRIQNENGISNNIAIGMDDKRRIVFISIIGLFKTYKQCPAMILYPSIFILPIQKQWIYYPLKYNDEIQKTVIGTTIFSDKNELHEFMELLKWKDSQNLLFCTLDEFKYQSQTENRYKNHLVAPFWKHVSEQLTQINLLYDRSSNYHPLQLDAKWWESEFVTTFKSKYNVKCVEILKELYFITMKFKVIQEIICQSNPNSLNPITSYPPSNGNNNNNVFVATDCCYVTDDEQDEENQGIWMISEDYDC